MFKVISFLLKFYPVISIVISVVEAFMNERPGEEKKAVVMRAITDIAAKFGVKLTPGVVTIISESIDAIVAALNVMGIFKHKDEDEPKPVAVTPSGKVVAPVESDIDRQLKELEEVLLK
jgi:hypothetical protein